jgi:hypothetical protein
VIIALDTETDTFSPGNMAPPLACVSLAWEGHPDHPQLIHHSTVLSDFLSSLLGDDTHLVGHSIDYDTAVLCAHVQRVEPHRGREFLEYVFELYDAGRIHDVYVRRQFMDNARGQLYRGDYSLEAMAKEIGITLDKNTWRLRYGELRALPLAAWPAGAVKYPKEDARAHLLVYEAQEQELTEHGEHWIMENAPARTAYTFSQRLREVWGVMADGARVARLDNFVSEKITHYQKVLVEAGLMDATYKGRAPNKVFHRYKKNTKVIKALLQDVLGDAVPFTEAGNVSTSKDVLLQFDVTGKDDEERAESRQHLADTYPHVEPASLEALVSVAHYGKWDKVHGTYVKVLKEGVEAPIHSHVRMLETGRYGGNKNMLTLPRQGPIRPAHKAREGKVFCCIDLDTAELRAWSQIMVDLFGIENAPMAQLYQADPNADPHVKFGAEVFLKKTYEEGLALLKAKDPDMKKFRQASKAANFGLPGGLGAEKFIAFAWGTYRYRVDPDEAPEIIRSWKTAWNAWPFFKYIEREINTKGYLIQHRSNRVRGNLDYCNGCNTLFQGLNADAVTDAAYEITKVMYTGRDATLGYDRLKRPKESVLYGARLVNIPHDEVQLELDEDLASEQAFEAQRLFNMNVQKWLPDVPVTSSPMLSTHLIKEPPKDVAHLYDKPQQQPDGSLKYLVYQVPEDHGYEEYA